MTKSLWYLANLLNDRLSPWLKGKRSSNRWDSHDRLGDNDLGRVPVSGFPFGVKKLGQQKFELSKNFDAPHYLDLRITLISNG
jgi:hypothetical protein